MPAPTDDLDARTRAILARLVGFDTTSRNSNLELIAWVEAHLAEQGVGCRRVPDETGTKASLWATIGPDDRPGWVLSGHTDVVPVDGQAWTSDPFTLTARDGRLVGRGTTDMKGFLACCLAMVPAMRAARLATPIHLAFSYDEEVGCVGVRGLLAELARGAVRPLGCFVGEPTGMDVVVGHKGKRSLAVAARGRACHSSLAPHGVNAVEYAARLAVFVSDLGHRLAASGARDEAFDVPFSTAHVGPIAGGQALNIVPEACRFEFEVRNIAADDADALVGEVAAFARDVLEPQMRAADPAAGIDIALRAGFPGLDTAPDAPITVLAKALAGRNGHGKVAYGTEAGLFVEMAGIPAVVVGPGHIATAHTPDEFIEPAQLAACRAFIDRLIARCTA